MIVSTSVSEPWVANPLRVTLSSAAKAPTAVSVPATSNVLISVLFNWAAPDIIPWLIL